MEFFLIVLRFLIRSSQMVFICMLDLMIKLSVPNIYADSFSCLILQCCSLFLILTLFYRDWSSPLSLCIWPAMFDFSFYPLTTAFWCFSIFNFCWWFISSLYVLLQLHEMECIVFDHVLFQSELGSGKISSEGWTTFEYYLDAVWVTNFESICVYTLCIVDIV